MIWRDEAVQEYENMQKKREFARDLDHQIELRKAREEREQREMEEFRRRFEQQQPEETSPPKWWQNDGARGREQSWMPPSNQQSVSNDGMSLRTQTDDGAPSATRRDNLSPYHDSAAAFMLNNQVARFTRFRVTDQYESNDRMREKMQQLEWRRLLDEQVEEKHRREQEEKAARERMEREVAQEELAFLREQQLRARRKYGLADVSERDHSSEMPRSAPSLPLPPYQAPRDYPSVHHEQYTGAATTREPSYYDERTSGNNNGDVLGHGFSTEGAGFHYSSAMPSSNAPPPAPMPVRSAFDRQMPTAPPTEQSRPLHTSTDSFSAMASKHEMMEEYKMLLKEIRSERLELRREKEELRREREELRSERIRLQQENERFAALIEQQKRANDYQQELQLREQQQQLQRRATYNSKEEASVGGYQQGAPSQSLDDVRCSMNMLSLRRSSGKSEEADQRPMPVPAASPVESRASRMSMAEFRGEGRRRRHTNPHDNRQSAFRRVEDFDGEINVLEQSLIGESVFVAVPLSSQAPSYDEYRHNAPERNKTSSPTAPSVVRNSVASALPSSDTPELTVRDARVIKSRGFYDLNQDELDPEPVFAGRYTPSKSQIESIKRAMASEDTMDTGGSNEPSQPNPFQAKYAAASQPPTSTTSLGSEVHHNESPEHVRHSASMPPQHGDPKNRFQVQVLT